MTPAERALMKALGEKPARLVPGSIEFHPGLTAWTLLVEWDEDPRDPRRRSSLVDLHDFADAIAGRPTLADRVMAQEADRA